MATNNKDFKIKNGLIVEGVNATVNGSSILTAANSINALSDVAIYSNIASGQVLKWSGTEWVNGTDDNTGGGSGTTLPNGTASGQILSTLDGTGANVAWIDNFSTATKHQVKLAESINKGQAVYVSSATGNNMLVSKASNAGEITSSKTMGLLDSGGVTNDFVNLVTEGLVTGTGSHPLDTTGANSEGDAVWLGTDGNLIYGSNNAPKAPAHLVFLGIVTRKHAELGEIFVRVQNGFETNELHDVYISNVANGDVLYRANINGSNSLWTNGNLSSAGIANLAGSTFTGNVSVPNITVTANINTANVNSTNIYATTINAITINATSLIGNGLNITSINATALSTGTIPSTVLGNSTVYVGTTAIGLNRASQSQTLTGISIDGNANTVTNGVYTTDTGTVTSTMIANSTIVDADISSSANIATSKLSANSITIGSTSVTLGSSISSITGITNVNSTNVNATTANIATIYGTTVNATTVNATSFAGNGSNITSINATAISTGTIPNARTTANTAAVADTIVLRDSLGSIYGYYANFSSVYTSGASITGNVEIGLAEKQAAVDTGATAYTYGTNTYNINLAAGNYFANITPKRVYPTGWTEVGTGISGNSISAPATFSLTGLPLQAGDIVIVFAATEAAAYPTTTSSGWSTQVSGSTTYAAALFWKQMGATPDTSIVLTSFTTNQTAFIAKAFRPTSLTYGSYIPAVIAETTAWSTGTSATPDAGGLNATQANALAVTVMSNENLNVATVTPPSTYVNTTSSQYYASSTLASFVAMAYKNSLTGLGNGENAGAWSYTTGTGSGTPSWSATTLFLQAYADPTISLTNTSFLSSGSYNASTYVLNINNASNATLTWSGPTFKWQNSTAPTLSSSNNIVVFESTNGITFHGGVLTNYA